MYVPMETRQLGKGGPYVPIVCFGTWALGGAFGKISEQQAVDTVHAALDLGLTFIDTAQSYRDSEKLIGKALQNRRSRVFLATKFSGLDHSRQHIEAALEASLKALRTDFIDLYQIHQPSGDWPIEQTMGHLLRLKEMGKIRYIGVSNFSSEQTVAALKSGPIHSSQPRYSLLFRDSEDSVLPCCFENGLGVMAFSVLAKGLLGGRYRPGDTFQPDDERYNLPYFQREKFEKIFKVTERLQAWAMDQGRDIAQLAIAWVLSNSMVTSSIVGCRTPDHVRHNVLAADWTLTASELQEIEEIQGDLRLKFVPRNKGK